MINVLNVLMPLCAAAYMFAELKMGFGISTAEIPCEFFRDLFQYFYGRITVGFRFVLCVLAFEVIIAVSSIVCNRYMKNLLPFIKPICVVAKGGRFLVDVGCIIAALIFMSFEYMVIHESKSFEFVDANGNSKILVSGSGAAK